MCISNVGAAIILSSVLSIILPYLQAISEAKVHNLRSFFHYSFVLYVLLTAFGHIITTLLAISLIESYLNPKPDQELEQFVLAGPIWFWYATIGVFGFEVVIQKFNVSFFGSNVLSINAWISKAKKIAVERLIENYAIFEIQQNIKLAAELLNLAKDEGVASLASKYLDEDIITAIKELVQDESLRSERLAQLLIEERPAEMRAEVRQFKREAFRQLPWPQQLLRRLRFTN